MGEAVIVIGCGKSKLEAPARARELYTGSLFRMARLYAEAWNEPWFIVSAKYGLMDPERVIEPYEMRLQQRKGGNLQAWADRVATGIKVEAGMEPVQLLMGRDYAEPIGRALDRVGLRWCAPMDGFGLGHRLQWLKARAALVRQETLPMDGPVKRRKAG